MRLSVLVSTHLLAVALGVFFGWDRTPEPEHRGRGAPAGSEGDVDSQLKQRLQSIAKEDAEWDREYSRFIGLDLDLQVAESLAEEEEANRLATARHLELVGQSRAFDRMEGPRLHQVLTDSLIQGDGETAQALFLSWYRRDAFGALDQLILRPGLLPLVVWEPAVVLGFDPESVGRWAARKKLPAEARDHVLQGMAESLASHDDLDGLQTMWSLVNPEQHETLAYSFASGWIPDEGAAAVETLFTAVPDTLRDALIENLAPGPFVGCGLGGSFLNGPLFATNPGLDGELVEAFLEHDLSHLDGVAGRFTTYLAQHNEPGPDLPDLEAVDDSEGPWTADHAENQIESSLNDWLIAEMDFPERIMAGDASIDDALNSLIGQVPALAAHPDEIKRQLFAKVFLYAPEEASSWASTNLPPDDASEALRRELTHLNEPRAAMRQRLLDNMPDRLLHDEGPFGFQRSEWDETIAEWEQLKGTHSATEEP